MPIKPNDVLLREYEQIYLKVFNLATPLCFQIPFSPIISARGCISGVTLSFSRLNEFGTYLGELPVNYEEELNNLQKPIERTERGKILSNLSIRFFEQKGKILGKLEARINQLGGGW
jgi:hypothetical protein